MDSAGFLLMECVTLWLTARIVAPFVLLLGLTLYPFIIWPATA
jgi:hypothetical protein